LVYRVTRLAHIERVPTCLQRCPGVRVRRLLPLPLESDVTVAADRERRLRVAHAHEDAELRRQLHYDIATTVHDPLVDTPRDAKPDDGRHDRSQPFSSVSSHGPPLLPGAPSNNELERPPVGTATCTLDTVAGDAKKPSARGSPVHDAV